MSEPQGTTTQVENDCSIVGNPAPGNILFRAGNPAVEILRLDSDGMVFKGQRINDAGEAHKAFMEAMNLMRSNILDARTLERETVRQRAAIKLLSIALNDALHVADMNIDASEAEGNETIRRDLKKLAHCRTILSDAQREGGE